MTSLISVKDLYDKVAVTCGFPTYVNDTDTPDITRFILEMISEGLHSTLDVISANNAALNLHNEIVTIPGEDTYAIDGIIKHIEIPDVGGKTVRLRYADNIDFMRTKDSNDRQGLPRFYAINNGYLRLYPTPDKEYTINMELSTHDLVLANNDVYKNSVTDIDDSIIGDKEFEAVIAYRTIALMLVRCQSPNAKVYAELGNARLLSYIEKTYGSNEAQRGYDRNAGHYNSQRGLLG